MTDNNLSSCPERRARWLGVLARSEPAEVARLASPVLADHRFDWLRRPERALVMVRSRIGNTGDRFNLGEATVTRCAVKLRGSQGREVAGVGHVMGHDEARAERVAQLDALLQLPSLHELLWQTVVQPLEEALQARHLEDRERAEASRVRFYTLQPGD